MTMYLQNKTIRLRALEPSDLDLLYVWENDTSAWDQGCAAAPFSARLLGDYLAGYSADIFADGQLRLVVEEIPTGIATGLVDLCDLDMLNRRVQTGVFIDPAFRGRGYGRDALKLMAEYALRRIGLRQVWAVVGGDAPASQRLVESAGFHAGAVLPRWLRRGTEWVDGLLYQIFDDDVAPLGNAGPSE